VNQTISELKDAPERILHLFRGAHLTLVVQALSEGNTPGRIWVDNSEPPQTALLWDTSHCFYLGGYAYNRECIRALKNVITKEIIPEAKASEFHFFKVYYTSDTWEKIVCTLFDRIPVKRGRTFYAFNQKKIDCKEIPPEFSLVPIDEDLLKRTSLQNFDGFLQKLAPAGTLLKISWKTDSDFV
jgi:hypothetical protein